MENTSHYYCTAEWHFARLTGNGAALAPIIYEFAFHITTKSPIFFASIPNMAKYFGVDERTVRKALRLLVKIGFFELVREMPGRTTQYLPVRHKAWAEKHPGRCTQREETPAYWDKDQLGLDLYAASGGHFLVLGVNVLKGMRNTGHSDDAVRQHFAGFLKAEGPFTRDEFRNGFLRGFMAYLRAQPVKVEAARAAAL